MSVVIAVALGVLTSYLSAQVIDHKPAAQCRPENPRALHDPQGI